MRARRSLGSVEAVREPDALFAAPALAALYDDLDPDRSDLEAYLAIAREVRARSVLDVGCGTGCLALLLAGHDLAVIGVDPAEASVDVARTKPGAERVRWVVGDARSAACLGTTVDLATMTGNVAQVFVDDDDWHQTLGALHACLRPEGWLVFETRRSEARDWERWEVPATSVRLPDGRSVSFSRTVSEVSLPTVTFESGFVIDGVAYLSESTLRFRDRTEITQDLSRHDFEVVDVREAADRPGKEMVFLARRRRG